MRILLDTNMVLYAVKHRVDIFDQLSDHELMTLSNCVNELEKLSRKKGKDAMHAKIALQLLREKGLKVLKTTKKIFL